jgi:alpha-ribazole phosphatase
MTIWWPPSPIGATRVIFVRHGEPDDGVRGRCYGRSDPGLSPRGRAQMRRAWRLLSRECVAAIYSSPSRRALESVEARATETPAVTVDNRLREIDFGQFEGLAYEEIARRFPEQYGQWMTRPTEVVFPGGERFGAMSIRVLEVVADLRRAHQDGTVVVVSHGGVNRIALAAALEMDRRRIFALDQTYASVNVIDYFDGHPIVRVINAVETAPC